MFYSNQLRLSGKNLGNFAMPNFCQRCEWFKLQIKYWPNSPFPGIFSSIDSFTKHYVHGFFDQYGHAPGWLKKHGDYVGYIDPPSWHSFNYTASKYNIMLTGAADGIMVKRDGKITILDYKTAKYTKSQDAMLSIYETQLNAYKLIAEKIGLGEVDQLLLAYFGPQTGPKNAVKKGVRRAYGMSMNFNVKVHEVSIDEVGLSAAMAQARLIFNMAKPPKGKNKCKNCKKLAEVGNVLHKAEQEERSFDLVDKLQKTLEMYKDA